MKHLALTLAAMLALAAVASAQVQPAQPAAAPDAAAPAPKTSPAPARIKLTGGTAAPKTQPAQTGDKPLMKDFIGLNVHTVQFKPELYKPVCRLVRDYHGMNWDTGVDDTSRDTTFPMANNQVDWLSMYRSWLEAGFEIDACIQFGFKPADWKNPEQDAYKYGKAFAEYFGPTKGQKLVTSVEIGNEPAADYKIEEYAAVFDGMAKGIREGDPALKILTATVQAGKPDKYSLPLDMFRSRGKLYDVINVHTYSLVTGWPTWERSFPEDPKIDYLQVCTRAINWRNVNAKDKEVWITEFGYDASIAPAPTEGTFKDWVDVSDEVQAQWIVRSFLVFSELDIERAYLYWFNDDGKNPQFHGASGITRDYQPKMSYWAMKHLYETLGEYRFSKAVTRQDGELFVFEYVRGNDEKDRIWVVWSPTGEANKPEGKGREVEKKLELPGTVVKAERMPMADGPAEAVDVAALKIGESPVYIWLKMP